jgi:hypothetical protein
MARILIVADGVELLLRRGQIVETDGPVDEQLQALLASGDAELVDVADPIEDDAPRIA